MRLWGTVALATFLLACGSEATPDPAITPVVTTQHIDLWELDLSITQASLTVTEGSTVGLTVDVVAETDSQDGGRCAEPAVIDPFGNVLAKLSRDLVEVEEGIDPRSPPQARPGILFSPTYVRLHWRSEFAFVAASTGVYKVELDNRECNVRREPAEATVTWTVKTTLGQQRVGRSQRRS